MQLKDKQLRDPSNVKFEINQALEAMFKDLEGPQVGIEGCSDATTDLVVAFSGGCDSVSLLTALVNLNVPGKGRVIAVHVHHNLSPNADYWAGFCEEYAKRLGIEFVLKKVIVPDDGEGVEASARKVRYDALEAVAKEEGACAIVTAHHLDDQLETFLIQWMRGSGPEGLIGMPYFKQQSVPILRPFLSFTRADLEAYAREQHLKWVEDESNQDNHYMRNFLRNKVLPVMKDFRPGFKSAADRSIELLSEAVQILKEVAESDLKNFVSEADGINHLNLEGFFELSEARRTRVFRLWLSKNGFPKLPRVRLLEVLRQAKEKRNTHSSMLLSMNGLDLYLDKQHLIIVDSSEIVKGAHYTFQWLGQSEIEIPGFGGSLIFEENPEGFSEIYLKAKPLTVKYRQHGEKIKLYRQRPSKPLKQLFQDAGIPSFERKRLPLLWREDTLIFVAGLGEEIREKADSDVCRRFSIRWEAD